MIASKWRINNGILSCGTLRIAKMDYDTDPTETVRRDIEAYMVGKLNSTSDIDPNPWSNFDASSSKPRLEDLWPGDMCPPRQDKL